MRQVDGEKECVSTRGVLQIKVKPKNEKTSANFTEAEIGITKRAGEREIFANLSTDIKVLITLAENQRSPEPQGILSPMHSRCAGTCFEQRSCKQSRACLQTASCRETGTLAH